MNRTYSQQENDLVFDLWKRVLVLAILPEYLMHNQDRYLLCSESMGD
jgi:hypothetical protein